MAGMRAGLNGARSGLFMEQIRIIQEMRDADRKSGRTGVHIRPRFGVWENVVGALSSGRDAETGQKKPGADFQKVLEAFLQVEEPYLHVVRPETGRWEYAGGILGVRSSVAWIVWDAQHFGVPQRRRRVFLVADFAGYSAIPILALSQTACLGILRRAECRGKSLPPLLEAALRMQAGLDPPAPISGEAKAYHINQRNEGIDLDGVSGALMATQNLQMQTFITNPGSSQSGPQKQIAFAANQRDEVRDLHDVAGALGAQPGMKQQTFVAGFSAGAGASAGGIGYNESVAPTLKGSPGGNCMPSVLCLNDQGGQSMAYSENITGTLRAQERGHQPLVLNPADPLLYENYGIDSRYTGPHKIAPTLSARMGTGGLNTSLVQQVPEEVICIAGNAIDRLPQNGGNGFGWQRDISYTLTTSDRHGVYARQRVDEFKDGEVFSTQSARQHKDATDLICQQAESYAYLIRRLTPLECERLQGFPDGWTDIPGASDSARYKALGNSLAIPCVEFIMSRIAAAMRAA